MLYETLLHGHIFCSMLYFGLISGIILEIKLLVDKSFKNKIITIILDVLLGVIFAFIFVKSMNIYNYGEFRLYLLIAYCFGIVILHKTIGFLVEKLIKLLYNLCIKILKKLKKVKVFSKIFR